MLSFSQISIVVASVGFAVTFAGLVYALKIRKEDPIEPADLLAELFGFDGDKAEVQPLPKTQKYLPGFERQHQIEPSPIPKTPEKSLGPTPFVN